ncbi:MAG: PadR family transcriptional regulator [Blastocatellia bacterium]
MNDTYLYSGLVRLHILHHACEGPIFGLAIIDELARHGYKLSGGTLYPVLHGMERKGYLRSWVERQGRESRRFYVATPLGRKRLKSSKIKVAELFSEIFEVAPDVQAASKVGRTRGQNTRQR